LFRELVISIRGFSFGLLGEKLGKRVFPGMDSADICETT